MVSVERREEGSRRLRTNSEGRTGLEDVGKCPERTYSVCAATPTWKERLQSKYQWGLQELVVWREGIVAYS
jgi:hypothetical protein